MKNYYLILAVGLLFTGLYFTACDNRDSTRDDVEKANQDMIDSQTHFEKEWDQFKSDAEVRIDNNAQKIAEFKAAMKTTTAKFKAKYENEVLTLQQSNIELRKKLNDYKYEGKNNWDVFKRDFNREVDMVVDSLNDIFSRKE